MRQILEGYSNYLFYMSPLTGRVYNIFRAIDNSEYVVAAWDMKKSAETYETICYAREQNMNIVILDINNCRLIPDIRLLE